MTELTDLQKYEFRRSLEEVRKLAGRGTELISLYIPPSRQISDVANYLRSEYSQSSNIKSASTRKNVQAAISSILSRLKNFKAPPENGLVFFVGHRSIGADQTYMIQFVLEPPDPVPTFIYRCDSQFFTEPLIDMLEQKDGLSMGGYGTWSLAFKYPGRFAALVPICGGVKMPPRVPAAPDNPLADPKIDPYAAVAQKVGKTPVWIFHCGADTTVPVSESREMEEALKAAGGNVRYTEYPNVGHNSWDKAYAEREFMPWLLAQRRPR